MGTPNILIIEDDIDLRSALIQHFSNLGYKSIAADSISAALIKLKNQKFSIILLDLHLKSVSGTKILDQIKNDSTDLNHDTPIMIISGFIDQNILKTYGPRVADAIVKPFSLQTLQSRVENILIKK